MNQDDLIKKAQSGEEITQADIDKTVGDKKKEVLKQLAIGTIFGAIMGFLTQTISKLFGKNGEQ